MRPRHAAGTVNVHGHIHEDQSPTPKPRHRRRPYACTAPATTTATRAASSACGTTRESPSCCRCSPPNAPIGGGPVRQQPELRHNLVNDGRRIDEGQHPSGCRPARFISSFHYCNFWRPSERDRLSVGLSTGWRCPDVRAFGPMSTGVLDGGRGRASTTFVVFGWRRRPGVVRRRPAARLPAVSACEQSASRCPKPKGPRRQSP